MAVRTQALGLCPMTSNQKEAQHKQLLSRFQGTLKTRNGSLETSPKAPEQQSAQDKQLFLILAGSLKRKAPSEVPKSASFRATSHIGTLPESLQRLLQTSDIHRIGNTVIQALPGGTFSVIFNAPKTPKMAKKKEFSNQIDPSKRK